MAHDLAESASQVAAVFHSQSNFPNAQEDDTNRCTAKAGEGRN
jgi:hypothetical protein